MTGVLIWITALVVWVVGVVFILVDEYRDPLRPPREHEDRDGLANDMERPAAERRIREITASTIRHMVHVVDAADKEDP